MKKQRSQLPLLIFPVVILSLALVFRGFLLEYFVEPVALIFWAAYRLIASVDQKFYWLLLIFCSFLLVLRVLPPQSEELQKPADTDSSKAVHGVKFWQRLMQTAAPGKRQNPYLREKVKNLVVASLAVEEKISDLEALKRVEAHQADLPASVYAFILPAKDRKPSFFQPLRRHLPAWIDARIWGERDRQQTYRSVEQTFQWIESTLEIHHDD